MKGEAKEFKAIVMEAFKPVHLAIGETLARLAERGILARTHFDAEEGILIVWL